MNYLNWKTQTFRFLSAQTISLFGSSLVQYAIIWHITLETSSGSMVMLSVLFGFLPQLAVSLWAGAWLDRYDRKKVMILADAAIALCTLVVAICFLSGFRSIGVLLAALAFRSLGTGIQTPAVNAFLPQIVPPEKLVRVNGINGTLTGLTVFLSPAASALVLANMGMEATFFIDVITAVIGITLMFTVHSPGAVPSDEHVGAGWHAVTQGLAYLKRSRFIRQQVVYAAIVGFLVSPAAFLGILLVTRTFGPEVWRLSLVEMTFSGGAALGGLLIAWWGGFKNHRKTLVVATLGYGVLAIALGFAGNFISFLVFNTLAGIVLPCYNAPLNADLQQRADPKMMGRVFALMQIAMAGALPAGMLVFGPLADCVSVQSIFIGTGVVMALFSVLAWKRQSFIDA